MGNTPSEPDQPASPKDLIQRTLERKFKLPEGWLWCRSEIIGETDVYKVDGGIPRVLTRGPRKGRRTWDRSEITTYAITRSDMRETERLELEARIPDRAAAVPSDDETEALSRTPEQNS